jgi:hypothetical protein
METMKIWLLGLFLLSGCIFVGLGIPLIRGWVGPNPLYGFRIRRTLANPKVWYAANRYAGWWMLGVGVGLMLAAAAFYAAPGVGFLKYALICGAVEMGGLLVGVVQSFRYVGRLRD